MDKLKRGLLRAAGIRHLEELRQSRIGTELYDAVMKFRGQGYYLKAEASPFAFLDKGVRLMKPNGSVIYFKLIDGEVEITHVHDPMLAMQSTFSPAPK